MPSFKKVTFPVVLRHVTVRSEEETAPYIMFVEGYSNGDGSLYFTNSDYCRDPYNPWATDTPYSPNKPWSVTDPATGMSFYHGRTRAECVHWCEDNTETINKTRAGEHYEVYKARLEYLLREAKEKEPK